MSIGLNREFDTPIGGLSEFRGNLQGGEVFEVGNVPVYDGTKFAPGNNDALLNGFGGLATALSIGHIADGISFLDDWDVVTPLNGTPLQTTPDPITGIISVAQEGIYEANFQCNIQNLGNNTDYFFQLFTSVGATGFGTHVVGSNNVSSQSTGFSILMAGVLGGQAAIGVSGGGTYDVVSASFSLTRIG